MASKALRTRRIYVTRPRARRRSSGFTAPVLVLAGFMPLVNQAVIGYREGGIQRVSDRVVASLTGYDPATQQWNAAHLVHGAVPIGLGIIGHKLASKLGVNRALAQAGIPFIRL